MPAESSERESILLLMERQREMKDTLIDHSARLKRGDERFTQITVKDLEFGAALAGLRQDFSRAMLAIEQLQGQVNAMQRDLTVWQQRVRGIAWFITPVGIIVLALAEEFLRRWLFP